MLPVSARMVFSAWHCTSSCGGTPVSNPPRAERNGLLPSSSPSGPGPSSVLPAARLVPMAAVHNWRGWPSVNSGRIGRRVKSTKRKRESSLAEHFLLGLAGDLVGLGELADRSRGCCRTRCRRDRSRASGSGWATGCRHWSGRRRRRNRSAADVVLPVIGGVALVVRGDQVIGVGHRGAVHREPTDRAGQLAVGVDEAGARSSAGRCHPRSRRCPDSSGATAASGCGWRCATRRCRRTGGRAATWPGPARWSGRCRRRWR